jgi:hypothetical protein
MAFLFRPFLLLDVSGESRLGIFLCFADDRFFTAKAPRAAKIIMGFAFHISHGRRWPVTQHTDASARRRADGPQLLKKRKGKYRWLGRRCNRDDGA